MSIIDINNGEECKPTQRHLTDAIYKAIDDIATGRLTHIEILGALDYVSKQYFFELKEDD